tara:strand:- start:527 stop:766 length:240 start_codon:yes stop_codon:yes gene_type:complete
MVVSVVQNNPQGTSDWFDNADQQVATMPVTQAVTPKMKTVVSSCSFLVLIGLERAIAFLCLQKGCHRHVGFAGKANTLH